MTFTTGLFVFCPRTACFTVASLIRDLSLKMPADEKARSGLMLAGGICRKLEKFCEKRLLPPPENRKISFLIADAILGGIWRVCLLAIVLLIAI